MKDQLQLLITLNEIDVQLDDLQGELKQVPLKEKENELEFQSKKVAVESKSQEIVNLEKQKSDLEKLVEESRDRMVDFQSKLSMIKTNKEYQAAVKEIEDSKKLNQQRENQILEITQKLETLAVTKKEAEEFLEGTTVAYDAQKKEHEGERSKVTTVIGELTQKREALIPDVEARYLAAYRRIRTQKSDAVVSILSGTCQGCHMKVSPQMRIEMQKAPEKLFTCPACQRVLYLPGGSAASATSSIDSKVLPA